MSLKVVGKVGETEMECNIDNTSDINSVHLEGKFLFSILLETEIFDQCGITFFYKWLKAAL